MKKILLLLIILISANIVSAEDKIPVRIKPAQIISTVHDEIEIGDKIHFKTADNVYKYNRLFIKKDTPVIGIVSYVYENGWTYDNAQIDFKQFRTRDVNGKIVIINSKLSINGFELLKYKSKRSAQFFNYCGVIFRGKEVEILPEQEDITFNIWLTW